MSFFKKVLSSVGIGGAKVDTVLSQKSVRIGEDLEGVVNIVGGNVEQTISRIEVELKTEYLKEIDDSKVRCTANLLRLVVARDLVIAPNERKQIPFGFTVPKHTPVSMSRRNVWVETELEIPLALDPEDRDYIDVRPSRVMDVVLDAVINVLGFRLREVECEAGHLRGGHGEFTQEFEFVPQSAFRGKLDELEITFLPSDDGIMIYMQVDRRVRGLKSFLQEAAGLDESYLRVGISEYDASQGSNHVARMLEDVISRYC
ncbi:sporulation protein [Clostridium cellulovorans]|uniref:SpoOM family protein n=1 Tax=Clostridium cellulovorans (strain ATCC 35296 / DSM 3052 / OCM 3 / 743B) TaxID=573061 RepID=D9STE5_CLOC7|nr:sporulation protein [Clostridium cellulovorans]ADL50761.1 SpoOM family protein [Clostridium cellulovorans 743B]